MNLISLITAIDMATKSTKIRELRRLMFRKKIRNNTKVWAVLRTWMIKEKFYQTGMLLEKLWDSEHPHAKRIYTRIIAATGGLHPETDPKIVQEVNRIATKLKVNITYKETRYKSIREEIRLELPPGPTQGYTRIVSALPAH